jgi:clan AA aspartic protease (TIGR02281 family)
LAVPTVVNRQAATTFLVDTGATFTVITPKLARLLGVEITPETPHINILTANGKVAVPVVTLHHVALGDYEVENVQAVVQDLGASDSLSGLLGMNFFRDVELTVRRDRLILGVLQPTP